MNNAVNTYKGYIKDIMINPVNPAGGNFGWDGSMRTATSVFTTLSNASKGAAALMQPIITGGGGDATLSQLQQAGIINAQTAAILAGGLGSAYNPAMTASQVQGAYVAKADGLAGRAAATADKYVDAKQTGLGLTPIVGVNLHFEKLNIGLKYEYKSFLGLTNETTVDDIGFFPDGAETGGDMPAIIAGGADYQISDKLKISGSFTYFLDNKIGWGNNVYGQERTIDKNYLELAFGAEYKLTDKFTLSAGYLNSNAGVSEQYLSDFSYVNDANGVGAGFQWKLSDRLTLDAGAMVIMYKDQVKNFDATFDPLAASMGKLYEPYKETYSKEGFSFAFGIAYKIF
jgi:long-chain fatty acid transport protein